MTAPNGKTNIRWLSYQPLIASEPYLTKTVPTGNRPRNYPTIWPYTQIVLFEPPGEIGTPKRRVLAIKQSIKELWHLTYFTDFIIVHRVQCSQCHNLQGCWIQASYAINAAIQGNHVRTNECVQHVLNVARPGWDGISTGGQSRDLEWNQWCPRSINQDQKVVTNIALWKYKPRSSHKT